MPSRDERVDEGRVLCAHDPTRRTPTAVAGARLDDERRTASLLDDVREAIFGAQNGLMGTLAVGSAVEARPR